MAHKIDEFSVGEAAKVLRVSVKTLRRWDASGRLKAQRRENSNHRYYTRTQLERFIQRTKRILYDRPKQDAEVEET